MCYTAGSIGKATRSNALNGARNISRTTFPTLYGQMSLLFSLKLTEGHAVERLGNRLNQSRGNELLNAMVNTILTTYCYRPKHPVKVHVWGAISLKGPAKLCIFDGIMDSPLYVNILETTLLPFLARINFQPRIVSWLITIQSTHLS